MHIINFRPFDIKYMYRSAKNRQYKGIAYKFKS